VQPASDATGANFLEMEPPALNRAMSTPLKLSFVSSSTVCVAPSQSNFFPADLHTCRAAGYLTRCSCALQASPALMTVELEGLLMRSSNLHTVVISGLYLAEARSFRLLYGKSRSLSTCSV
jgi:hypothetical protein